MLKHTLTFKLKNVTCPQPASTMWHYPHDQRARHPHPLNLFCGPLHCPFLGHLITAPPVPLIIKNPPNGNKTGFVFQSGSMAYCKLRISA